MTGKQLNDKLKELGVKQIDLAKKMKISPSSLTNRLKTDPKLSLLKEISKLMNIPLSHFLDTDTTSMIVNETEREYGNTHIKDELLDCYRENRLLHNKLQEKDQFIIQILQQNKVP